MRKSIQKRGFRSKNDTVAVLLVAILYMPWLNLKCSLHVLGCGQGHLVRPEVEELNGQRGAEVVAQHADDEICTREVAVTPGR